MSNGWKLVPVEPTDEMVAALGDTLAVTIRGDLVNPKGALQFAIDAAPQPPSVGDKPLLTCWNCLGEFTLHDRSSCDGCCWKCGSEIELEPYLAQAASIITARDQHIAALSAQLAASQKKVGIQHDDLNRYAHELAAAQARIQQLEEALTHVRDKIRQSDVSWGTGLLIDNALAQQVNKP